VAEFPDHPIHRMSDGEWVIENPNVISVSCSSQVPASIEAIINFDDGGATAQGVSAARKSAFAVVKAHALLDLWQRSPTWRYLAEHLTAGRKPLPSGPHAAVWDPMGQGPALRDEGIVNWASEYLPPCPPSGPGTGMREWRLCRHGPCPEGTRDIAANAMQDLMDFYSWCRDEPEATRVLNQIQEKFAAGDPSKGTQEYMKTILWGHWLEAVDGRGSAYELDDFDHYGAPASALFTGPVPGSGGAALN